MRRPFAAKKEEVKNRTLNGEGCGTHTGTRDVSTL
jgi:hypothetical protein